MPGLLSSARASLPQSVRVPIGRVVNRSPMLARAVNAMLSRSHHGFVTMTLDTPPAVTKALKAVHDEGLPGDYFEFGVFRGFAFLHAQKEARRLGLSDRHFYGFDSFAGLPDIDEVDGSAGIWQRGDYACDRASVEREIRRRGAREDDYTLIEGFFDHSLTPELTARLQPRPVAVALIDCDLYASTVPVLDWIAGLLQPGSVLLFDDWNCADGDDEMGERRAFGEFLAAHPEWRAEPWFSFGWHGQAFRMRSSS